MSPLQVEHPPRPTERARRRRWAVALVLATVMAHLWLVDRLALTDTLGLGAGSAARMEVAFVSELAPTAPPAVAPPPRPAAPTVVIAAASARAPQVAPPPQAAASAPQAAASAPQDLPTAAEPVASQKGAEPTALAQGPAAVPSAVVPSAAAAATDPAAGSAPAAPLAPSAAPALASTPSPVQDSARSGVATGTASTASFEWPPSTRLSYTLVGDFRGPVHGSARVEWLRSGERYQVHLDVAVGPEFAPLMSRRMSSDGEITAQGLKPRRYEEVTRVILGAARRNTMDFEAERIQSSRGGSFTSLPGVQDTASQFVQLTWMFITQPQLLRAGQAVEIPLALPRRVDRWVYDVVESQPLATPMGRIDAWYLRPRPQSKTASDLAVEIWFAPTLQYLPVRIRIRQDDASFVDLMLQRLPQQAASSGGAAAAPSLPGAPGR